MTEDRPMDKGGNGSWGEVFMLSSLEHSCLVHSRDNILLRSKMANRPFPNI
jgi:hypothetical protein